MLTLTTSTSAGGEPPASSAAWQQIDAFRHKGYSFTIQSRSRGWTVEVTPPRAKRALREGRTLTAEYGVGQASTLAKALSAALRDAGGDER